MTRASTQFCVVALAIGLTLAAPPALADGEPAAERTGVVAFEAESGLYVIDANGGTPRKIPGTKPGDGNPVWSPDGRLLSFERERQGNWDVYVMSADGSGQRRLTFSPMDDDFARWAPDGRSLVFQSTRRRSFDRVDVYAIRVSTGAARRVTPDGEYPDWAPDMRIIFAHAGDFFTVRPYGLDRRPLASQPPGSALAALVSNDGQKIAYIRYDDDGLFVAQIDGSEPRRLTTSPSVDNDPVWSPDDKWVAFDRGDSLRDIYVVREDGSELTRLTHLRTACCPDWRP